MEFITQTIDHVLHVDEYLSVIVSTFGIWTYVILFAVIFVETGLVVTPFLPGDSLLFATGTLAAIGLFDIKTLFSILCFAAVAGDSVNYWIGEKFGHRFLARNSKLLNKEHVDKTKLFFEKHGGKTIILARFVPIVRTFAPFVAGVGNMHYQRFLLFNVIGGISWVSLFLFSGYFFGNIPFVKDNFEVVVIGIVIVSVVPIIFERLRSKRKPKVNKTVSEVDLEKALKK